MKYPNHAKELLSMLDDDQSERRKVAEAYFSQAKNSAQKDFQETRSTNIKFRSQRMLEILAEIKEPSLSNLGEEAAQAISIFALHDNNEVLEVVLNSFIELYEKDPADCFYKAIPSMTDKRCILNSKPQVFGTQWMFDEQKMPFLPTVEDFEGVHERRAKYGLEPLRWPKSMAIPEDQQPWLALPLSEIIMRQPTEEEIKMFKEI